MKTTIKLYDTRPYDTEFSATVLSCNACAQNNDTEAEQLFAVVLDSTLFFPEEGGQSCDKGELDGGAVHRVEIKDGVITHYLEKPVAVGSTVCGKIDFSHRYRNMQHHSGEHIVSGIIMKHYGFSNVGFHVGSLDTTMDYDGVLSSEMLELIENEANAVIYKNIGIVAEYIPPEQLDRLSYRSKKELFEDVRIVTIENVDVCACCAPHVRTTGEVGMIKFAFAEKYKGGTRVHMHCGYDALFDFRQKNYDILSLSSMLSAKKHEIVPAVERLLSDNARLHEEISKANLRLCEMIAESVPASEKAVCIFENGIGAAGMRTVANAVKLRCPVCAVFDEKEKGLYNFIIASDKVSAKALLASFPDSFSAKGGGGDRMVQGTLRGTESEIRALFDSMDF